MGARFIGAAVAVTLIVVIAAFIFGKQRAALAEIGRSVESAGANTAPTPAKKPIRSIRSNRIENVTAANTPPESDSSIPPESERMAFLKEMRALINTHDSGMTTFRPSKEYSQKIHSMDVATLTALLSDLEKFQTNWSNKSMMKGNILSRLVLLEPEMVLDIAHADGGSAKWSRQMRTGVRRLAQYDPDAASRWFDATDWAGDAEWKQTLIAVYAQSVAAKDIRRALEAVEEIRIDEDVLHSSLRGIALAADSADDREIVGQFIAEVESSELADRMRSDLVRGALFRKGFRGAAAAFSSQFGKNQESAARNESLRWIATEALRDSQPAETAQWLLSESAEETRVANLEHFIDKWIDRDYNQAATWIGKLERGAERDAAIAVLIKRVEPFDPGGAAAWRKEIGE